MAIHKALGRDSGYWAVVDSATEWSMACNTQLWPLLGQTGGRIGPIRSIGWSCQALAHIYFISTVLLNLHLQQVSNPYRFGARKRWLRNYEFDQCWEPEIGNSSETYPQLEYTCRVSLSQPRQMVFPFVHAWIPWWVVRIRFEEWCRLLQIHCYWIFGWGVPRQIPAFSQKSFLQGILRKLLRKQGMATCLSRWTIFFCLPPAADRKILKMKIFFYDEMQSRFAWETQRF